MTGGQPTPQAAADSTAAWEDPPRRPPPGTMPVLSVAGFEGPLDWLLELARAKRIDLSRLSIVALIDSFASALQAALAGNAGSRPVPLALTGDWLVMAATLVWLRSRLLLPADTPAAKAAGDEADLLRRQLVGRVQAAAAADWLERQLQLGRDVFARGAPEHGRLRHVGDLTSLLRACLVALQVPQAVEAAYQPRPPALWTVADALQRFTRLLADGPEARPLAAFLPQVARYDNRELRCRGALASTLVAGLELARSGDLSWRRSETSPPRHAGRSLGADGDGRLSNGSSQSLRRLPFSRRHRDVLSGRQSIIAVSRGPLLKPSR